MSRFFTLLLLMGASGCGDDAPVSVDAATDANASDGGTSDASDGGGAALAAHAGPSLFALVGEEVTLDGSASTGAVAFLWSYGDGTRDSAPTAAVVATKSYDAPGRYSAVLTVFDTAGARRSDTAVVTVTHPAVFEPQTSSTVMVLAEQRRVAVVNEDSDELSVFDYAGDTPTLAYRVPTGDGPRTLSRFADQIAVVCRDAAVVQIFDDAGAIADEVALPSASRPFGAVEVGGRLFVTLSATGQIARVAPDGDGELQLEGVVDAIADARGIARLPDGRVVVTRWRSPDDEAQMVVVDATGVVDTWTLAYDPQAGSDTESGGVPSYLEQVLVSPDGRTAALPSLQAALGEGLFRSPRALTHETTVRAVVSFVDVSSGAERFEDRKQFDDRGLATAGVFTQRGDFLFLAMRGSRVVERFDVLTGGASGSILNVGFAPDGLALSGDDRLLFVNASLSRELVVYDVSSFDVLPEPLARLPTHSAEVLPAEILRGKQLFNDSFDTRIARDGYIACAHCHLEGVADNRTWDFTDWGEGLRNTISLLGRGGAAHGPIHWSGNFDEVQDFEHDMRGPFRGLGLMEDSDFESGTRNQTLGDPKAGVSADLDALAAYVTSLDAFLTSPFRNADGTLSAAAERGRLLFESPALGCGTCHGGPRMTDSTFLDPSTPMLHDVGTLGLGSGQRLGDTLSGIDTPTVRGLWHTAPYLHDGSAPRLQDVVTTRNPDDQHGVTGMLSDAEVDDLLEYLRSL